MDCCKWNINKHYDHQSARKNPPTEGYQQYQQRKLVIQNTSSSTHADAIMPKMIINAFFLKRHLMIW